MKRLCLILFVLLLAAPAMAEEPLQLARMSGPMLGSGAEGCSESSNEIGTRTQTSTQVLSSEYIACNHAVPDCSGKLKTGNVYFGADNGATPKVLIFSDAAYSDDSDEPTSSDTLISVSESLNDTLADWVSGSMDTEASVTEGGHYWICIANKGANISFGISDGALLHYQGCSTNCADTPPDNLGAQGGWSSVANNKLGAYVTIGD